MLLPVAAKGLPRYVCFRWQYRRNRQAHVLLQLTSVGFLIKEITLRCTLRLLELLSSKRQSLVEALGGDGGAWCRSTLQRDRANCLTLLLVAFHHVR